MVASRSARERKAAVEAGPLGKVRIDLDGQRQFLYKIACTSCTAKGEKPWSTHRAGGDNGYLAAMDRWTFHLVERHPGEQAPCLVYLEAAQKRLTERRKSR
jgi:hypothetical protein